MTYMWILKKEPPIRPGTPDPHKPKYSQTMKSLVVFSVVCYLTFLQNIIVAVAAEGGYSNYIPGFYGDLALATEPPTEFSIRNDVYYYSADTSRSARSGQVELNAELTQTFNFLTFLHKPGIEFFGGQYAYGITGPYGNVELDTDIGVGSTTVPFNESATGFGDLILAPIVLYWNNENFHYMFGQYVVTPTGDYEKNDALNVSLNYWTFETDFAMTYLNEETGQNYSFVIGYNYNTENDDTDYQTGDEIHFDYVVNQFLSEYWAVGLNGFYLKQIGGDSGTGAILGDFKAEAAGIGPSIMWIPKSMDGEAAFIVKWIHDYHAENRLEGDHVFLSFAMSL